ncbi:MAG TPA: hypothetical protein ENL42_01485, partial [Thermoplasmatales archaeon]|nr:hypothetical protein [Thermoplasmatales archaeon]
MKFDLKCSVSLSRDGSEAKESVEEFFKNFGEDIKWRIDGENLLLHIISHEKRSHQIVLQLYKRLAPIFGKHKIGMRGIHIDEYEIEFEIEKNPLH